MSEEAVPVFFRFAFHLLRSRDSCLSEKTLWKPAYLKSRDLRSFSLFGFQNQTKFWDSPLSTASRWIIELTSFIYQIVFALPHWRALTGNDLFTSNSIAWKYFFPYFSLISRLFSGCPLLRPFSLIHWTPLRFIRSGLFDLFSLLHLYHNTFTCNCQ